MASSLIALLVFENIINKELVRSLHVYRLKDGKEKEVEREFFFSVDGPYVEMKEGPILRLRRFQVLELFEGQVIGLWRFIFAFHVNNPPHSSHSSFLLSVSRNPKLKSIPTLAKDIHFILKLSCKTDDEQPSRFSSKEICEVDRDNCHQSKKSLPVLDQDLNCLPYSVSPSELSKSEQIDLCATGVMEKKKKRAASEDIARIALEDVVKCFGLPIVEASRNLKVGLTVLKRKCRELGILAGRIGRSSPLTVSFVVSRKRQKGINKITRIQLWQWPRGEGCWRGKGNYREEAIHGNTK